MSELIVIAGPTAIGKTAVSIKIAQALSCDILSCDSRQMYQEMKIGTAVPEDEELSTAKHHFIQQISVHDYYNVSRYESESLQLIDKLFKNQKQLILTGGSGLYIDAVCKGIDPMPDPQPEIREALNKQLKECGLGVLLDELEKGDNAYFQKVDKNNPARIIRALEILKQTGIPYSEFRREKAQERPFKMIKIALDAPRDWLYERINRRVDIMMEKGLFDEAQQLYPLRHLSPLKTVGYRELFAVIEGEYSLEEGIQRIKNNTRKYARKQLSWLRRDTDFKWFAPDNWAEILEYIHTSKEKL